MDFECRSIASLLEGRAKHGLVQALGTIYAIGGIGNETLRSVERLREGAWRKVTPMNYPRVEPSACACGKDIYVFSGEVTAERYRKRRWEVLGFVFPIRVRQVGLAVVGDRIIVAGGKVAALGSLAKWSRAWEYNYVGGTQREIKSLPQGEAFSIPGWDEGGKAAFVGGMNMLRYDGERDEWETRPLTQKCKVCHGDSCGDTCLFKEKYLLFKAYRMLKSRTRII